MSLALALTPITRIRVAPDWWTALFADPVKYIPDSCVPNLGSWKGSEMASKKSSYKSPPKGKKSEKNHLGKAGETKPETRAEKIKRKGRENLYKMFANQSDFQEILAEKILSQRERVALVGEIEKIIRSPKFYRSLDPRDLIFLLKSLDDSNLRWMGLGQKFLSNEDAIHTHNKLTEFLVSLEKEIEQIDPELPYSPEFRAKVRGEYMRRVLGITPEPENPEL